MHRAIRSVIQKRNPSYTTQQPQYIPRRPVTFEELQADVDRVVALSKECIELNRRATKRHLEEAAKIEERMNQQMKRDRTCGQDVPQQQQQLPSAEEIYKMASQQPEKFSQFIQDHEQELKKLVS